ncbi:MAG: hypothetical protein ABIA47_04365 [bacterium]
MDIKQALAQLQEGKPIVVNDKTFVPEDIEEIKLDTGELVYWVRDGESLWLAVDPSSEEVILFNDVEADIDSSQETVFYNNADHELSSEGSGVISDEGEEVDRVDFLDYESDGGEILRVISYEVTGDSIASVGRVVPEEELQEA